MVPDYACHPVSLVLTEFPNHALFLFFSWGAYFLNSVWEGVGACLWATLKSKPNMAISLLKVNGARL